MDNKAFIDGCTLDVITPETFHKKEDYYKQNDTGIQQGGYVYPVRNCYDPTVVGFYPGPVFDRYVRPSEEQQEVFSDSHVTDFSNADTLEAVMLLQDKLNKDQKEYLTTPDNVFRPIIDDVNDSPIMIGLKQSVIDKNIDINRYAHRFGINFNNDKRQLNKGDISINKFTYIADKLDMKATLIIEDKNPNVPNPIGHKIVVDLISTGDDE